MLTFIYGTVYKEYIGSSSLDNITFLLEIRLATDWQINLTVSRDRVKLFYIIQYYDRPVPQFIPKFHRVHIEREGQCEQEIMSQILLVLM